MTNTTAENGQGERQSVGKALRHAMSLPGKLLGLSVVFVLIAEIMIFVPSAMSFRTQWMMERVDAAYLAALAAENAGEMGLSDSSMREILSASGIIAVSRVTEDANELILADDLGGRPIIVADLTRDSALDRFSGLCDNFFANNERNLRIIAMPSSQSRVVISVIVPESELREDLFAYSRNITILSLIIALITGTLIYIFLLFIFVSPMRRLAEAMSAFQRDPTDPSRAFVPSNRNDEIGQAERALAAMEAEVRSAFMQRERLAALGGAVARINHDLRNVLASAQLISDRLSMNQDARIAQMGARLLRAVDRGVRLCEDTLQYGKTEERLPELRPVHLSNALDDAAGDAFAASGAVEWTNTVDEGLYALADADHFHRIIVNLVRNAVQAMSDGHGSLSVEAEADDVSVVIRLTDTGPGIPDAVRNTLFQPFGQTGSKGGTGLGLSIAQELTRAMGGSLQLARTDDTGTQFELILKIAE